MSEEKVESKVYNSENLPEDFSVDTSQKKVYPPVPAGVYQAEVLDISITDNFFYKPNEVDPKKRGSKYVIKLTLVLVKQGEHYGKRFWENLSPYLKPTGKLGPTRAYKFVSTMLGMDMDWEECDAFAQTPQKFYENMKAFEKKQVMITVEVINKEDGTKKNKIASFFAIEKPLPPYVDPKDLDSQGS